MKKFLLLSTIAILFFASLFAQNVGINNDGSAPNASAMLDVKHPNKGLLVPRVTLTGTGDITTIPSPATSLLVYNTTANGGGATAVVPGYYYWSGSAWQLFSTGSGSASSWSLTGNAGTVDGANFIGTTDNIPFNIRVNNERAGRIDNTLLNTFWGYQAGNSNTTGTANTANGCQALFTNTSGFSNTANGHGALYFNTSGSTNTADGAFGLAKNTTGFSNTASGFGALYLNTTGHENTASGMNTLRSNTTGNNNTANGSYALFSNATGYSNVAMGAGALYSNVDVSNLVAIGDSALYSNTTGIQNTAVGSKALNSNTIGDYNTAFGYNALRANGMGNVNTAYGVSALQNNTTGGNNTAVGSGALSANSTAYGNTAVGNGTLAASTGYNNTAIGSLADVGAEGLSNTIAIGSGAIVNASNTAQVGNEFVTDVYFGSATGATLHAAAYNTPSDNRFKYDIKDNVPGLDFIKKLKPVTYYLDDQKLSEFTKTGIINNSMVKPASYIGERQLHTGFLAQDVEKTAGQLGYSFDGVHVPADSKDYYSLSYSQFVMPLVKSVQEQQQIIEEQNKKINNQAELNRKMNEKIETLAKAVDVLSHK